MGFNVAMKKTILKMRKEKVSSALILAVALALISKRQSSV